MGCLVALVAAVQADFPAPPGLVAQEIRHLYRHHKATLEVMEQLEVLAIHPVVEAAGLQLLVKRHLIIMVAMVVLEQRQLFQAHL